MAEHRSFTDYVRTRFDSNFWAVAEEYLKNNIDDLDLNLYRVHRIGEIELSDVKVEYVWVHDLPGMKIQFDVALSIDFLIHEGDYHYDDYDEKKIWIMVRCRGDLAQDLKDFEIYQCCEYNGKNVSKNPMDDALVPVLYPNNLDAEAEAFLRRYHFHKCLLEPCWVQPDELAKAMGLTIRMVNLTKDGSIFGRCYFQECETELYDAESDSMVKETIPARTILVDRQAAFMSNIGRLNNTIIHECVHWDYHQKAFVLARLYDKTLSNIGCTVIGGIDGNKRDSVDWMEWQANSLTPRIQMPISTFKKRVQSLISKFRQEMNAYDMVDIIQPIIDQLVLDFGVSRTAAKIRLIDAGYEEALGAFIYLDGRYVEPHKAAKGFLKKNQTFSVGAVDAAILAITNSELKQATESGRYLYVDSHFVLNLPQYVEQDVLGTTHLTHYARNHMEECCLVFDLEIKNSFGQRYHSECFLNRDEYSPVSFNIAFHGGVENAPHDRQMKKLQAVFMEENRIFGELNANYIKSLETVIKWRGITYKEIGERAGINQETVSRCVNGKRNDLNTLILICLALHLPYKISMKIINDAGHHFVFANQSHLWYDFVLQHMYGQKVAEVKTFLAEQGADPL